MSSADLGTSDPTAADREVFPYQPGLDGLRALAVLAVIAYHNNYSWATGGFLGVDAFFVLSGFLITTLLVLEYRRADRIGLVAFWGRRLRRLMPALLLVLVFSAVTGATYLHPFELTQFRRDGLSSLFYVANWRFIVTGQSYFDLIATPSPFRHLWSLAIEEQFYLCWPLVVFGCLRIRKGRTDLLVAVCAVGAVASAIGMAVLYDPKDPTRAYFGTDTRVHTILIGALLALLLVRRRPIKLLTTNVLQAAGVATALALAWSAHVVSATSRGYYGVGSLAFAVGVAIVIAAATAPAGVTGRLLGLSPLRAIGRISYGLYLWHWPIIVWLTPDRVGVGGNRLIVIRVAVTFVASIVSYRFLEEPIRRGRWFPRRSVLARLVAPVAIATVAVVLTSASVGAVAPPSYLTGFPNACPPPTPEQIQGAELALTTMPMPPPIVRPPKIAVFGDSVACSLAAGLTALARTDGYRFGFGAVVACGVVSGEVVASADVAAVPVGTDACRRLADERRRAATAGHAPVALLASSWERADLLDHGTRIRAGTPAWYRLLTARMDAVIGELQRNGTYLVLVTLPSRSEGRVGNTVVPTSVGDQHAFDRLNDLWRRVAARHPDAVTLLDFAAYVCPGGSPCPRDIGGVTPRAVDGAHYTPSGSIWALKWLLPRVIAANARAHPRA